MSTTVDTPDTTALTLTRFVHRLQPGTIPADVSLRARHLMLDAIGCALAARREDFALKYAAGIQALDGDETSNGTRGVIGFDARLPLRSAALLNGVMTHGLDYDDTHMTGIIHLSVSVLPTVLALAAQRGATGAQMLTAFVSGIEAGARIASATRGGLHAHGFHPTGVVGAFASTLAAGKLLGLDEATLLRAQGIVLSLASGSLQFIEDGAWTKRMHPGWAAQAALTAVTLAQHGIPAPTSPYEGRFGFYRCYLGQEEHAKIDLALATANLDAERGVATVWETTQVAIKPFPICHFIHASADAAIALHRGGLDASRIASVEVRVPEGVVPSVCEPLAAKRIPTSDYEAKFSLPYGVASGLLRGKLGLKELEPAAFEDPTARALMSRISYVIDPASTFPKHYTGEVRVTLDDGRVLAHREPINRGHAERPLSNDEIREKYRANATLHFPQAHADAVAEAVTALDRLADVRTLETLLARGPAID